MICSFFGLSYYFIFFFFLPWVGCVGLGSLDIECSHSLPALHSGLQIIIIVIIVIIKKCYNDLLPPPYRSFTITHVSPVHHHPCVLHLLSVLSHSFIIRPCVIHSSLCTPESFIHHYPCITHSSSPLYHPFTIDHICVTHLPLLLRHLFTITSRFFLQLLIQ